MLRKTFHGLFPTFQIVWLKLLWAGFIINIFLFILVKQQIQFMETCRGRSFFFLRFYFTYDTKYDYFSAKDI